MPVATVVGAGVIGVSWAHLFAEAGWQVRISDPRPDLDEIVQRDLAGLPVTAFSDLAEAASDADFVQESGPESPELKREMFATLAAATADDVVLASSSSSLPASAFAEGNAAAGRILIGHPFNPPRLIPLVEVVPSPDTAPWAVDRAVGVYRELDRLPIRLKKEIPGFVGNRLQRAFNDQATYLVQQGVIDPADLDDLVTASLGLRWATVGPFESMQLGGGPAGMRHLVEHVGAQMTFDLGAPDPDAYGPVVEAVDAAYGTGPAAYGVNVRRRDRRTRAVIEALAASDARAQAQDRSTDLEEPESTACSAS
ncbi:hydroxylacyl-CoA dehydrogenase [Streptomyces sp. AC563]|uniref:3-hydroxyacyl-CoA dehydrogenase NAD-binding domain-containing protein n=1 Tax=Streptomyces buecherae TaxID=2763006 RepID=UPI00164E613D|nr:3-hydroxyacyl-CoA dehydrogenase NAD-binding domain-containing protein [Streptomyces buecherae]MBC3989476.1 hydroxylacyl-CoA dehydrogenase [Streptomyces buecherae]